MAARYSKSTPLPPVNPAFDNVPSAELPFTEASARWFSIHTNFVGNATRDEYERAVRVLNAFFGETPLGEINRYSIARYQDWRKDSIRKQLTNRKCNVSERFPGHVRINKEIGTLRQIMDDSDLWEPLKRHYKPLPCDPIGPGQALTPKELLRLFEIARQKARCFVTLQCSILSANTTAGPGEIRNLRLRDIDLEGRTINVRQGTKNTFRLRPLPLNDAAAQALRGLLERAKERGSVLPDHYLLPARCRTQDGARFDPMRPMRSWKTGWSSIRQAFASEFPERAQLRRYDLRHTAITHLLSNPDTPPQVVSELAGHCNGVMLKRYSHQTEASKRAAVERLAPIAQPEPIARIDAGWTQYQQTPATPLPQQRQRRVSAPPTAAASSTLAFMFPIAAVKR